MANLRNFRKDAKRLLLRNSYEVELKTMVRAMEKYNLTPADVSSELSGLISSRSIERVLDGFIKPSAAVFVAICQAISFVILRRLYSKDNSSCDDSQV